MELLFFFLKCFGLFLGMGIPIHYYKSWRANKEVDKKLEIIDKRIRENKKGIYIH